MTEKLDWETLKDKARVARQNAYAPYSSFRVGAAIFAGGRVFSGCNVENAAYPVGICAERSALSAAVTAGCRDIEAVVIAADRIVTPCGMCRQALAEFNPKVPIMMIDEDGATSTQLDQLLPNPFGF